MKYTLKQTSKTESNYYNNYTYWQNYKILRDMCTKDKADYLSLKDIRKIITHNNIEPFYYTQPHYNWKMKIICQDH
jgi:hypothetical protein